MKQELRITTVPIVMAVVTASIFMMAATACKPWKSGVEGKIMRYGKTEVITEPRLNARGGVDSKHLGYLTAMTPVTVECHLPFDRSLRFYKISYNGGRGYISDNTDILTNDHGVLQPSNVPRCRGGQ